MHRSPPPGVHRTSITKGTLSRANIWYKIKGITQLVIATQSKRVRKSVLTMQGYDGASAAAGQVAGNQGQAEEPGWYANFMAKNTEELLNYMQYTNLCNAICILTVGVLGIFTFASTFNFNILFIGLYTTIFGCLLCCLESRFEAMTKILRKYFGFLFSFMGRTLFLRGYLMTLCSFVSRPTHDRSSVQCSWHCSASVFSRVARATFSVSLRESSRS